MNDDFDYSIYDNINSEDYDIFHDGNYLILRDTKQYNDVENFKPYELTNCIVFEMAIRNKEVVDKLIEFYNLKNTLFCQLDTTSKIIAEIHLKQKHIPVSDQMDFPVLSHLLYLIKYIEKEYYIDDLFGIEELFCNYNFINIKYEPFKDYFDVSKVIDNQYQINKSYTGINLNQITYINKLNAHRSDSHSIYPYVKLRKGGVLCINEDTEEISKNFKRNCHLNNLDKVVNTISHNFSRPLLKLNPKNTKLFTIDALNFKLPKKELEAYFNHIYTEISNNIDDIKSPDEYIYNTIKFEKGDPKNFTPAQWADCFFIYDYHNISNEQVGTIRGKLSEIFNEKYKPKNKSNYYCEKTLKERLRLMKILIDDGKYKTLI